ncbi:hypothetical protein DFQ27_008045 [Actinomortierella ambigua]|uniref:Oligopeptide transporter n=1 Tax=Actinomortierella ambigua TaxID=1343610 RepID=A0A9P6UBH2_9FUNG|nr:hypothetical protein DFQ27_008045 [Actinomortierella ambigua]
MSDQKTEYVSEKAFAEKHDIESPVVELDEEENSPIPEVAAVVSNKDDPTLPVMTFRYFVLAILFSAFLSFMNMFLWFRSNPMYLSPLVVQLLAYPAGMFLAKVLPHGFMNPGPFNIKEHVLISLTANCAAQPAYSIDVTVIQKVWYKEDFGFLANLLLCLCTQMVGYGMAGVLRRYLVYPSAMIWPANLVQVALFNTLHKEEDLEPGQWSRYKFFLVAAVGMFCYTWLPGYIFPVLATFSWICWLNKDSILHAQVFGPSGMAVGVLAFDWNTIVAFLGSPLIVPWWAIANIAIGVFLIAWVMTPIAYYTNLWDAQRFPMVTSKLYRVDGSRYSTLAVMTDGIYDPKKGEVYGPLRISTFFALTYGVGFAALASLITHTILYHRHKIAAQWRASRSESEDIHHKLMQAYPEVPDWWYGIIFVVMTVVSIITCEVWDYKLPWWGCLLAVAMSVIFALPVGLVQAVTNQQPGLNIITEYVIGYILPGKPIAVMTFKTLGYISMAQGLLFVGDLKLGHYMKVPPRNMFWAQILGTVLAAFLNLGTATWLLNSQPGICETNEDFMCPSANVFYSASVIWGVIAPDRMFGPTSIYNIVNYFFFIGFALPIPFYFLKKKFPNTILEYLHIPVILNATGMMPPASPYHFWNWIGVGFIFQYVMRRYRTSWYMRFNYVMSAAFDSGVAFFALICFFALQMQGTTFPHWWGNPEEDHCPLDGKPTIAPPPPPPPAA